MEPIWKWEKRPDGTWSQKATRWRVRYRTGRQLRSRVFPSAAEAEQYRRELEIR
jgi:hypothetical protein